MDGNLNYFVYTQVHNIWHLFSEIFLSNNIPFNSESEMIFFIDFNGSSWKKF